MLPLTRSQQARLYWLLDNATDTEVAALPLVLRDWAFALRQRVHTPEREAQRASLDLSDVLRRSTTTSTNLSS